MITEGHGLGTEELGFSRRRLGRGPSCAIRGGVEIIADE